jgi:GDP/UDP-N,N'-diacetylbacillosamine 2-epimerase (hydrolysing)
MKRKICIVTGARAEYDLLKPLMRLFQKDAAWELQVVATCMHLSPEFGLTVKLIEEDGFLIKDRVEMLLSADTGSAIAKSTGLGVISFADSLRRLQPDVLVVLGDRFETLSVVLAAFIMKIPVVHIQGGEITKGAFDEGFRHAITKMSYLHFTATEVYRQRVIQLGETPERVFNVGSLGVESAKKLKLLSKEALEAALNFKFRSKNILVTFHPVTLEVLSSEAQMANLLSAFAAHPDLGIIFTKANADTDGRIINTMIDDYVKKNKERSIAFTVMGHLNYFSALQYVDAVVGNSSSGIIEAPSFGIGTVNIGARQTGRIKAASVIDCEPDIGSIQAALGHLFSSEFQASLKMVDNPYEQENTSQKIHEMIDKTSLNLELLKKQFYDLPLNFTLK